MILDLHTAIETLYLYRNSNRMGGRLGHLSAAARLVAVGVLVRSVADVEQLLPEGSVLRPKGLGGLRHEPHAIGQFHRILGDLVQLELRRVCRPMNAGGLAQQTDRQERAARVRQGAGYHRAHVLGGGEIKELVRPCVSAGQRLFPPFFTDYIGGFAPKNGFRTAGIKNKRGAPSARNSSKTLHDGPDVPLFGA